MKSLKENKVQILAAIALAFSLGMVVPSAAFAATETEDGIEAQAEGGENTTNKETLGLSASIAELYKRIQTNEDYATKKGFATYRSYVPLIQNTEKIKQSDLLRDASVWASETKSSWVGGTMAPIATQITSATKTALTGKMVYQVIDTLKEDAAYTGDYDGYKTVIDGLETAYTTLQAEEVKQVKAVMPSVSGVDTMDFAALVSMVENSTNFDMYVALYDSLAFLTPTVNEGVVNVEALNTLYDQETQMKDYLVMANAAKAIDAAALDGLYSASLPNTSVGGDEKPGVNTPDTGIVGLIESGALDLGTITLIVSVAVAGVAGLGLIAKLYLKHKF